MSLVYMTTNLALKNINSYNKIINKNKKKKTQQVNSKKNSPTNCEMSMV